MADPSGILDSILAKVNALTAALGRLNNSAGSPGSGNSPVTTPAPGVGSGGPISSMMSGSSPDYTDPTVRKTRGIFAKGLLKTTGQATVAAMGLLPTAEEAMNVEMLGSRQMFYGQSGISGHNYLLNSYRSQRGVSALGSPTSAFDSVQAMNYGAGMGLMPGLSNFGPNSSFGGIMGGAALASNLSPGLGITGGMGVMASLNQARKVNSLRMIGVNVRGAGGNMNDLPDIIKQIYTLLKNAAGKVTPQMIAVSAMSGNALDSMLDQYFGQDENLRATVIAGLVQMANSGGANLSTSGTKAGLMKTGGMTDTLTNLVGTFPKELSLIQSYTNATNAGTNAMNREIIPALYDYLGRAQSTPGLGTAIKGGQAALTGLEVFGGIRGGAGNLLTDTLINANGNFTGMTKSSGMSKLIAKLGGSKKAGILGKIAGGAAIGAALLATGAHIDSMPGLSDNSVPTGGVTSTPVFTGAITVNVSAPPGTDPYSFGSAITNAMVSMATR